MNNLLKISDLSADEIKEILALAEKLKNMQKQRIPHQHLSGKSLGMIFAKSSTRTRVSFEVGMYQLGGTALFLGTSDIQLGRGETIYDTANTLSRYLDGIMIRTFKQSDVEELAQHASIPIINGLTDGHHPCQALADIFTVYEKKGALEGIKVAYVGDGNNVANSLMEVCAKTGTDFAIATPQGYECPADITKQAAVIAKQTGASLDISNDPVRAAGGADVIYTDTWISMGQEQEKAERVKIFAPYAVDEKLFSHAKSDAIFMHCLPAYRGFEMTAQIIDSPASEVFRQAENRMHVQKAIMTILMG